MDAVSTTAIENGYSTTINHQGNTLNSGMQPLRKPPKRSCGGRHFKQQYTQPDSCSDIGKLNKHNRWSINQPVSMFRFINFRVFDDFSAGKSARTNWITQPLLPTVAGNDCNQSGILHSHENIEQTHEILRKKETLHRRLLPPCPLTDYHALL